MTVNGYLEELTPILQAQIEKNIFLTKAQIHEIEQIRPMPLTGQLIVLLNGREEPDGWMRIVEFEKKVSKSCDCPDREAVLWALETIYKNRERDLDVSRLRLIREFSEGRMEKLKETYERLEECCLLRVNGELSEMVQIEELLYQLEDAVSFLLLTKGETGSKRIDTARMREEANMEFLLEEIERKGTFVLISNEDNQCLMELIADMLQANGSSVFLMKPPLRYESDDVDIKNTVSISIENVQTEGNLKRFYPVVLFSEGRETDNISYLLEYIHRHYTKAGHLNIVAQGYVLDEISVRSYSNKKMTRLSRFYNDKGEYNPAYARYGDYLEYISKIYHEDCSELLYKTPTKRFSIVIPARDSVETLRYTVLTCLEQEYSGDYEVLISDNSVENNEVYEFCKKLDDKRVSYIKTPGNLNLTKSFEYAYLHTSGEYVLSIGSDDGVLPWALSKLDEIIATVPEEPIIEWNRGFYAWPGFNKGQQNQLVIIKNPNQQQLFYYVTREQYLMKILENPQNMYRLPLLYINSCFKRSHMQTMLDKTGELFDGNSQDLYTGIEQIGLNERILNTNIPLTIAGMSSKSVGANSDKTSTVKKSVEKEVEFNRQSNRGRNVFSLYEHLVPLISSDVAGMYFSMMRAVSKGIFSEELFSAWMEWRKVFEQIVDAMRIDNVTYYEDMYRIRYAASLHGEKFLEWFDEQVLSVRMELVTLKETDEKDEVKRNYETGEYNGILVLDAMEYGVTNICEAVHLFDREYRK